LKVTSAFDLGLAFSAPLSEWTNYNLSAASSNTVESKVGMGIPKCEMALPDADMALPDADII
jgi:hypothetical protein